MVLSSTYVKVFDVQQSIDHPAVGRRLILLTLILYPAWFAGSAFAVEEYYLLAYFALTSITATYVLLTAEVGDTDTEDTQGNETPVSPSDD